MTSVTPDTGTMLSAALNYAERGWHVFPVRPDEKVPLGALAPNGQNSATTDPATIRRWWSTVPDANIGIACEPSGLYVVDIDSGGYHKDGSPKNGLDTWARLTAENPVPETWSVITHSGGVHLYFQMPPEMLKNTAGKLGPDVDSRGNGYVVAPPSSIEGRHYSSGHDGAVAPLPKWIGEAVAAPSGHSSVPGVPAQLERTIDVTAGVKERAQALLDELKTAPEGQGNNTASRVAFMLGQYVGAKQIPRDLALQGLLWAVNGWEWRGPRDERVMRSTIERQLDKGIDEPRSWEDSAEVFAADMRRLTSWADDIPAEEIDATFFAEGQEGGEVKPWLKYYAGNRPVPQPMWDRGDLLAYKMYEQEVAREARALAEGRSPETDEQRLDRMRCSLLSSAALDDLPEPEWLVRGWLPDGGLCQLVGASGSYKSFLAIDLAVRIASGAEWLGCETKQGGVVYLAAEGGRAIRDRIREAEALLTGGTPTPGLSVYPAPVQMLGEDWPALVELCSELGPRLVIVDTLARSSVGVEENSATETGRLVQAAADLSDASGATILFVHHSGHAASRGRGSSAIYAAMDAVLLVTRTDDMRVTMSTRQDDGGKIKDGEEQSINLKVTPGPLGRSLVVGNLEPDDFLTPVTKDPKESVIKAMEHLHQVYEADKPTKGLTQAEVVRVCRKGSPGLVKDAAGEGFSDSTVKRAFRELVKERRLASVEGTMRYVVPPTGWAEGEVDCPTLSRI